MERSKLIQINKDYLNSKLELLETVMGYIKQVEENPFLRRRWTFIDKMIAYSTGSKLGMTPFETLISEIKLRFEESLSVLDLNRSRKIFYLIK